MIGLCDAGAARRLESAIEHLLGGGIGAQYGVYEAGHVVRIGADDLILGYGDRWSPSAKWVMPVLRNGHRRRTLLWTMNYEDLEEARDFCRRMSQSFDQSETKFPVWIDEGVTRAELELTTLQQRDAGTWVRATATARRKSHRR